MVMRRFLQILILCTSVVVSSYAVPEGEVSEEKQGMIVLGLQHDSAWDLYLSLKGKAGGGERLSPDNIPDWSGIYTRAGELNFEPGLPRGALPTAKLAPEHREKMMERRRLRKEENISYDPISDCSPPGYPRWLSIPFVREFVVTPGQSWLISEVVNSTRRVYTDDRGHPPEEDRYPLYYGDSIGFWDGDRLIVHTNQLMAGRYAPTQPDHTEQVETVEIWRKIDDRTLTVDIWIYDPPVLLEPWYMKQRYVKLVDPDKRLRIRYWYCNENPNNRVYQTGDGSSQYSDFTFTRNDEEDVEQLKAKKESE